VSIPNGAFSVSVDPAARRLNRKHDYRRVSNTLEILSFASDALPILDQYAMCSKVFLVATPVEHVSYYDKKQFMELEPHFFQCYENVLDTGNRFMATTEA